MSGSRRGGERGVGRDTFESVGAVRGNRRKHGRCSFDPWRWSARRGWTVFYRGGEIGVRSSRRHLALDIVELLLLVVRVEGAWWSTTGDLGVTGLLLEGIRRRRIIDRREWQGGRRAATRTKRGIGRRRREDDCTRLVRGLSRVTKVVLWVLVHASVVGDRGRVERAVDHFRITTGWWEVGRRRSGYVVVDDCRVAEPGLAIEWSGVEVCILLTSALATDHPDGEDGDDRNTNKSCGSISSDGADAGAIVCGVGGRRKCRGRACRATGGLGDAGDGGLLSGEVSVDWRAQRRKRTWDWFELGLTAAMELASSELAAAAGGVVGAVDVVRIAVVDVLTAATWVVVAVVDVVRASALFLVS